MCEIGTASVEVRFTTDSWSTLIGPLPVRLGERGDCASELSLHGPLDLCKLDTLAMVMIWMHWRHRLGLV